MKAGSPGKQSAGQPSPAAIGLDTLERYARAVGKTLRVEPTDAA